MDRRLPDALGLALLAASPPAAAEAPSFDCARAEGAVETLLCEDADLAALDRRLADRFAAALAAARGLDAGAAEAERDLRAYQRGWIGGRNDCWKAEDTRACVEDAYLSREGELVATFLLEAPVATGFWACDGNPANEVAIMLFDTERQAIRIEYGDSVETGTRVPTASGARYVGAFGREFWEKGDEALFVWEEGTTMTCARVP